MHIGRPASGDVRRRGAPPAGQRLDRAAVVDGAYALIARVGVDGFSLRTLATSLGVRPAALYNHVRDRDDLLDAVVERHVHGYALPPSVGPWTDWVRAVARDLRAHLHAHPHLTALALARRSPGPARPAVLRRFMERLQEAGIDPALAHAAWHAVLHVVMGAAAQESTTGRDQHAAFEVTIDVMVAGLRAVAEQRRRARAAVADPAAVDPAVEVAVDPAAVADPAAADPTVDLGARLDALLRDHGV